jgi:5'-phosphate synthase pdxT subunit
MAKRVGILALQGDFEAHGRMVEQAGAEAVYVRTASDLERIDGLIIPGGESTTMLKLIGEEKLTRPLADFAARKPVFGTCAGAILAAAEVSSPDQFSFGWMDIGVERNAYGRQIVSRVTTAEPRGDFSSRTEPGSIEAVFIRAPIIRRVGPNVKVLASYSGDPVLVEEGRHMAATFHPELTSDTRVHQLFLSKL